MSPPVCFRCGHAGHYDNKCTQILSVLEMEKCLRCEGFGHYARNCPLDSGRCFRCNSIGHLARNCTKTENRPCYFCHEEGHLVRDCPKIRADQNNPKPEVTCLRCGHDSRTCKAKRGGD